MNRLSQVLIPFHTIILPDLNLIFFFFLIFDRNKCILFAFKALSCLVPYSVTSIIPVGYIPNFFFWLTKIDFDKSFMLMSFCAGYQLLYTIFIPKSALKELVSNREFHAFSSNPIPKNTNSPDYPLIGITLVTREYYTFQVLLVFCYRRSQT